MLDHEPETDHDNPGQDDSGHNETPPTSSEARTPAPRRRRAATRPAGPPKPVEDVADTPSAVVPEPSGSGSDAADSTPAPAKRTRRTAKKAQAAPAETAPGETVPVTESAATQTSAPGQPEGGDAGTDLNRPVKATRSRRTRKKAEPTPDPGATPDATTPDATTPDMPTPDASSSDAPSSDGTSSDGTSSGAASADTTTPDTSAAATAPPAIVFSEAHFPAVDGASAPTPPEATTEADVFGETGEGEVVQPAAADDDEEETDEGIAPVDEVAAEDAGEDATDAGDDVSDDSSDEGEDGSGGRRRRRRRGGRRRRRGGDSDSASDSDDGPERPEGEDGVPSVDAAADGTEDAGDADRTNNRSRNRNGNRDGNRDGGGDSGGDSDKSDDEDGDTDEGGRRRRRRRRRRGEDAVASPDDPSEVVVRVREPRPARRNDGVAGIDGSTRMEAKRQRRREGREAGRRRAPILSEAEFLARRESVDRKMIIRQGDDLSQIAVIEDGILVEHYVDRDSAASLIGNVYLGRVQNVLPSMEAAFIDIGRGRNAVLYAGEVDWTSFGGSGQQRKIESVLKSGTTVLVQVTKDPVGAKGARLTNHVSIPGRYIVYAPGGHLSGISRKLPDVERKRLKSILSDLVPETASVIVRTAAEGASEDELVRDVNRLKAQWEDIERQVKAGSAPQPLYGEPDLTLRIVRDLFTEDFAELIIQGTGSASDAYEAVDGYVAHVAPHLKDRLRRWDVDAEGDLFSAFRLDEQIAKGLERKVFLPSGGSLVIDRTEAMTVIDVNTGKFTGSGGNLEATVTSNNLEAAEEMVRQLRLRDIGGIIVIDFIDMVLPGNRELLLRRLVECLGRDRTRHQVAEVTSLGLVQMTRKKIGTGLLEAFSSECPHCGGRGYEVHDMPVESQKQPDGGARDNRGGGRARNERTPRGKIPKELKPKLGESTPDPAPDAPLEPVSEPVSEPVVESVSVSEPAFEAGVQLTPEYSVDSVSAIAEPGDPGHDAQPETPGTSDEQDLATASTDH